MILFALGWYAIAGSPTGSEGKKDQFSITQSHGSPKRARPGAPPKPIWRIFRRTLSMLRTGSLRERGTADYWFAYEGEPVVEVDHDDILEPDYLVRRATGALAWTWSQGLRN